MRPIKYIFIALVFLLVLLLNWHSLDSINQDIGRHLKTGQIIWQTKSVPRTNLFSFTEPNHPFINHHWLSEVTFYLWQRWLGLPALIILKVTVVTAAFWLASAALWRRLKLLAWLPAAVLGLLVFFDRSDVRPEIFSYLFFSFFLFALWRAKYSGNFPAKGGSASGGKYLNWLPLVELLWVNSHIYFFLGPLLLLFFLFDRWWHGVGWPVLRRVSVISFLTASVTLLNPNGLAGALSPFTILQHYGYSIVENQSIFFLTDYGILLKPINLFEFSLVILAISFGVALAKKQKIAFELLMGVSLSVLALTMIRNFGLYGLAFGPLAGMNLANLKAPAWLKARPAKLLVNALAAGIIVFLLLNVPNNRFYRWLNSSKTFGLSIPPGAGPALQFIKQNHIAGPVFNNFDVGSYLIWQLYPEQKVFVDGRPEAYSVDFFEKIYKPMQTDPAAWAKYSKQYDINYVLFDYRDITPWAQTFLQSISQDRHWPLVYLDEAVVVFLKGSLANRELIKKYGRQ